jgi:hypothetical protein
LSAHHRGQTRRAITDIPDHTNGTAEFLSVAQEDHTQGRREEYPRIHP